MSGQNALEQAVASIQNLGDYIIYFETQPKNWSGKTPLRENHKFNAEQLLRKWQRRDNRTLRPIPKDMAIIWNIAFKHEQAQTYTRIPQNRNKAFTFLDLMQTLAKKDTNLTPKEYAGVCDADNIPIYLTNMVKFEPIEQPGCVSVNFGAYGIEFRDIVDWDKVEQACGQKLQACFNDNFISFWEIAWNFNDEDDILHMVRLIPENPKNQPEK